MMRPFNSPAVKLSQIAQTCSATSTTSENELAAISVSGATHSDGQVQPGDLFIAMPGANRHGAEFIISAKRNGAIAALTDLAGANQITELVPGFPVLVVTNPRLIAGRIAALIYSEPMRDLNCI
jgi:UDP-N-acetylmuramoyl-L-alanyl-D-glutamate--2,6-diaminopimelate ligase